MRASSPYGASSKTISLLRKGKRENHKTSLRSWNLFIKTNEYCTSFVSNS